MPVRDKFHEAVKNGLQRDGWTITADTLYLEFGGVDMYVDLAAEKMIAAEKEGHKIAGRGQELRGTLAHLRVPHCPYCPWAVHQLSYRTPGARTRPPVVPGSPRRHLLVFFTLPFTQTVIVQQQLKALVYDVEQEVIVKWLE